MSRPAPKSYRARRRVNTARTAAVLVLAAVLPGCGSDDSADMPEWCQPGDDASWPAVPDTAPFADAVAEEVDLYERADLKISYHDDYTPTSIFSNYEEKDYTNSAFTIGDDGVIITSLRDTKVRHPVSTAQYAYNRWALWKKSGSTDARDEFLLAANGLTSFMDDEGRLAYPFDWEYFRDRERYFEAPWYSAMAQGQAMAVFRRAFELTGDDVWVERGNQAMRSLTVPIADGGLLGNLDDLDPSLAGFPIYEEYPTEPGNLTLNGLLFTLSGIYDWVDMNDEASTLLTCGVMTLKEMLPYFDLGEMTSYDLGHLTFPDQDVHVIARYHAIHASLLLLLGDLLDEPVLTEWGATFTRAVGGGLVDNVSGAPVELDDVI